jgi:hypothetical protein
VARIGQREWTTFHVDLVLPGATVDTEALTEPTRLVGDRAVDDIPGLTVLAIAPQLADKVCAMFERHGADGLTSSRPGDLGDIAMIAEQVDGIDGDRLLAALRLEESRRIAAGSLVGPLPNHLRLRPGQETDWRRRWTRAAPITFEDALEVAGRLLDPALAGTIAGMRWSAVHQDRRPR